MERINKWIPAAVLMGVIFGLSSMTGDAVDSAGLSKEAYHINGHFLLFFLLTLFYFKAVGRIKYSILLSVCYAFLDELHQYFVPGRSVQIIDIVMDSLGALFAGIILWKLQHILPKKLKNWLNS